LAAPALREEVFGPSTLVVVCDDDDAMVEVAAAVEGQLTATLHADPDDYGLAQRLMPLIEQRVGRVVFDGVPTGVAVCEAMHHGGPFPASTTPRETSVGTRAIRRFLRPVCYQGVPNALLPEDLRTS
jgi:NADP-dependent aldehyde dehydrogenase